MILTHKISKVNLWINGSPRNSLRSQVSKEEKQSSFILPKAGDWILFIHYSPLESLILEIKQKQRFGSMHKRICFDFIDSRMFAKQSAGGNVRWTKK